jgi:tousled-like kinase
MPTSQSGRPAAAGGGDINSSSSAAAGGAHNTELRRALEILKEAKKSVDRDLELKCRELDGVRDQKNSIEEKNSLLRKKLEETHRSMAKEAARRNRDRLAADSVRLGKFTVVRVGDSVGEAFEKGYAFIELQAQREDIVKRKEELESRKQELTKLKRSFNKKKSAAQAQNNSALSAILDDDTIDIEMDTDLDLIAEQYTIAMHAERLKKEELGFSEKEKLLDAERGSHEKELRRIQCEDKSKYYRDLPLLGDGRYSLLRLLGQGGFSEVWLALDLFTLQEVAVKIHQLNSNWSEDRQRAFVRHAKRELEIHQAISHFRVVKLIGCFDISRDAFATILEYCRGTDLDEIMKKNKNGLVEKEAKPILLQILSGLRFLSTVSIGNEKKTIIHYDLKPANILFDEMGDVKITDFGLSKVIDSDADGTSIDQTSHGAGTYWYLPPECFTKDK